MKTMNKIAVLFFSILCVSLNANANSVCSRMGAITECGEGKLNELHVAGKATLLGTTVLGDTHVAGMLDAAQTQFDTLEVSGKATLYDTKVMGEVKISGLLSASNSSFANKVIISSDKTYFTDSKVSDLEIRPGGDSQAVYLKQGTIINGNIHFTSGHGVVFVLGNSKIMGRVIGGYISQNDLVSRDLNKKIVTTYQ